MLSHKKETTYLKLLKYLQPWMNYFLRHILVKKRNKGPKKKGQQILKAKQLWRNWIKDKIDHTKYVVWEKSIN